VDERVEAALAVATPHQAAQLVGYRPLVARCLSASDGESDWELPDAASLYLRLVDRRQPEGSALAPDLRGTLQAARARFRERFRAGGGTGPLEQAMRYELVENLPALLHVEDRMCLAHAVESRPPLLDHRIVEFVFARPAAWRTAGGEPKHVLRGAASGIVPAETLARRDKMGFPVPFVQWVRGPARAFACDILLSKTARERGIIDGGRIEQALESQGPYERELWGMLCLELWQRQFIDGEGV
jgi:asparagine synthase (glutamine-hydrolysing)